MTRIKSTYLALVAVLLSPMAVNAQNFISFDTVPTDTTYIGSGLLLSSDTGGYVIGTCGNLTPGSNGCLGNTPDNFRGELTFTFVELGTLIPAVTDSFEIILCEGCNFRGSSAQVFDVSGGLLSTIDMNTASGLGNRTFSLAMEGIASIVVDLGPGSDGVQSLAFGDITSSDPEIDTTFSIVIIPDTQMYVETHPEIVEAQMDWIVANQDSEDIIYVGHLGDLKDDLKCNNKIVNQGSGAGRTEWQIIDDAFQILDDANIPYGVVPGNHDFDQVGVGGAAQCPFAECTVNGAGVLSCATRPLGTDDMLDPPASFNSVMGPSRFDGTIAATAQPSYGDSVGLGITSTIRTGNRAASNNEDNFSLVEFGDVKFVIINLGYRKGHNGALAGESVCSSAGNPELVWADALLKEYPDRLGIVTSHGFLVENQNDPGRNRFDDYGSAVHACLADNRNFLLMTSAHRWGESWGRNARDGAGWPPVHALLSDYQRVNYLLPNGTVPTTSDHFENLSADNAFGDGGYIRIMRFDTATGLVNIGTFAPPVKFADDSDVPYPYSSDPDNGDWHDDHWHDGLGAGDSRERPGLTSIFTPTYTLNAAGRIIFDTDNGMHQDTASNFCFTFWGYRGIAGEVPSVCPSP